MMVSDSRPRVWVVVPAAGVGRRMGGDIPKQYLQLRGKTILQRTLEILQPLTDSAIRLCVSEDDQRWRDMGPEILRYIEPVKGGAERVDSVLAGLEALSSVAVDDDWVLVHDAARPCLRKSDVQTLLQAVDGHSVGGILGTPVQDTVKRVVDGEITATEDRRLLWRALTPQVFRFGRLRDAIIRSLEDGLLVTDEASALENAGLRPLMVAGRSDNIKITTPEDLQMADQILSATDDSRGNPQ